jgi:N-carbamoylputrescine amidase
MVTVAAVQMACTADPQENRRTAERLVRQAAADGANIILLPELFERPYFCQERQYAYYGYATPLLENPAVLQFQEVAAELGVVLPISFYERAGNNTFNSIAMIDADGTILGCYRKTHIPDDHLYQEKFYFTPGDTGFQVWHTAYGCVGVGICWDQWFPETARCMALQGAEMLLYPTAIGSEPILEVDSAGHWQRCMQGHAAANILPVIAANRIGTERVLPCKENQFQSSEMTFYGTSFIADHTGEIVQEASREFAGVLSATFDLDEIDEMRLSWGLFRDRRPEMYRSISQPIPVQYGKPGDILPHLKR